MKQFYKKPIFSYYLLDDVLLSSGGEESESSVNIDGLINGGESNPFA